MGGTKLWGALVVAAVAAPAVASGCASIVGIGDITGPGDASVSTADADEGDAGTDAPSDDAGGDANAPCEGGACCGVQEICNNGIDDNCDCKIDCADPQCTSPDAGGDGGLWQCATLPSGNGWTIVAYDSSGRPACPANFSTKPTGVVSNVSAAADACKCNCTLTQPATCTGSWGWCDNGTTANSCCVPTKGLFPIDNGQCANNNNNLNTSSYFRGEPFNLATVPGKCSASVTATPPPVSDTQGETCSLAQAGGGCSALSECVPAAPSGFKLCSVYGGATTCPNGLVQSTVYTGYADTRGCTSCACSGSTNLACNATSMISFEYANCPGTGQNWTMTESCLSPGGFLSQSNGITSSERVNVTTNGTANDCTVTQNAAPTGGVAGTGVTTVCCLP